MRGCVDCIFFPYSRLPERRPDGSSLPYSRLPVVGEGVEFWLVGSDAAGEDVVDEGKPPLEPL
jgi:hypothetical protein